MYWNFKKIEAEEIDRVKTKLSYKNIIQNFLPKISTQKMCTLYLSASVSMFNVLAFIFSVLVSICCVTFKIILIC